MENDNDFSAAEFKTQDAQCGAGRRPNGSRVRQAPKPTPKPPSHGAKPSSSPGALLPRWEKRDLLKQVPVGEVLAQFGLKPNRDDCIRCILPGHQDSSPSMHVTPNRAGLHCFVCVQTLNALDVYAILSKHAGSFPELCDSFGLAFGVPPSNGGIVPVMMSAPPVCAGVFFSPGEEGRRDTIAKGAARTKMAADDAAAEALCGPREFVAEYLYAAAEPLTRGACVWRKQRFKRSVPAGSKCRAKLFHQHFSGDGGLTWGLKPQMLPPLLPFNWHSFASISSGCVVFINEGEKAVLRLPSAGLMATCGHEAGRLKRNEAEELVSLAAFLVVIPDADKEGWSKAIHNLRQLCEARAATGGSVRGIALVTLGFAFGSKKDAWDYLEEGGDAESLCLTGGVESDLAVMSRLGGKPGRFDRECRLDGWRGWRGGAMNNDDKMVEAQDASLSSTRRSRGGLRGQRQAPRFGEAAGGRPTIDRLAEFGRGICASE